MNQRARRLQVLRLIERHPKPHTGLGWFKPLRRYRERDWLKNMDGTIGFSERFTFVMSVSRTFASSVNQQWASAE